MTKQPKRSPKTHRTTHEMQFEGLQFITFVGTSNSLNNVQVVETPLAKKLLEVSEAYTQDAGGYNSMQVLYNILWMV